MSAKRCYDDFDYGMPSKRYYGEFDQDDDRDGDRDRDYVCDHDDDRNWDRDWDYVCDHDDDWDRMRLRSR
jgi:hypothetical protein